MATPFKEKYGDWALITGGTSGIGAELADQVAAKGLNVVVVARKEAELKAKVADLQSRHGIQAKYIVADLATDEGIAAVKSVDKEIGLLIPGAGMEVNGAFEKTDAAKEAQSLRINVLSTFELTHHFSRNMVARGKGGILLVSSMEGHAAFPYFANYSGAKGYVLNLGAALHGELGPKGVDVSVLSPGLTNTPMVADNGVDWSKMPLKGMEPADVAAAGLNALGRRFAVVPGRRNSLMIRMMGLTPAKLAIRMSEKMVRMGINPAKI